ncbi:type II secretion system secretin GspD [Methylobacter tundripaludum]|uniref:General secretion pathway protein D n=1 Tax=Methylobacter tundripaludum (strain ATCC BAA-1195 / DSM 17260 / SV96) TaxID=697282 RepID=G3IWA7_METTV|nr:type II secretion system secretin GspD [Methylobacter tundripaludum]EGW23042.1 general secretion pathway protein D [Methylobacter tundripaludum SV96]
MINIKKVTTTSCLVVLGLTLSSCESLGPQPMAKLPLTPVRKEQTDVSIEQLKNKAPATAVTREKPELFPGTNRFIPGAATQHRTPQSRGEGAYSLNFDEADLGEVAKVILSDILGQNYVLSPKVAGKVTLQTTDPLSKEELIPTLEMLLRMNNAVLVKDASIYHIEPASEALYSSSFAAPNTGGRSGFQVRVIPVRNVAVQDIVDVIKPLVQEKTILNVDSTRNILIASGTPNELGRVMDMVSVFDVDVLKGQSFGLFPLAHVEPETIIKELEEIFRKEGKEGESNFFRFIPVERLNAVMAITHQAGYLKDIENWIFRLDRANTASGGGVNVYRVQNVDAEELAATLNEIFTGAAKKEKSAKVAPGEKAAELTNKAPEKQNVPKTSTPTGEAEVANVGEVRIISDVANNSVIVVATPQEYEVILPVIKQLDLLPLQVLIDATIVSVKLTDSLKYGIQWFLDHGGSSISSGNGAATLGSIATASAAAFTSGGLTAIYNSGIVNALLSAQANKGNVNIISSPSLMVLNNQEAKINVGDQVPIQTGTLGSVVGSGGTTGATTAIQSSIQYKDTGVTLEVTPRVNANGMVIMDIKQTVSSAVKTETGVNTSPTIQKKEIESSVAVQDSETIVLGGLIDNNNSNAIGGIPWLNELPWIGPLFGNTDRENIKNELVVLITPRVVKSKQDSRLISDEFKRKLTGIYEYKAAAPGSPAVE